MTEFSNDEVEDCDAVQCGKLPDLLTFWLFGGKYCLPLQNKSEIIWEVKCYTGEVGEMGQAGRK
jgi:hypothetical protein